MLHVGYIWLGATAPGQHVTVSHGNAGGQFVVRGGFNSVYIPVFGHKNLTITVPSLPAFALARPRSDSLPRLPTRWLRRRVSS